MMATIAQQLKDAREMLQPVAQQNAALEARLLAAHAWGMSAEALVLHGQDTRQIAPFSALVERRMNAEPVAHILGEKHFWKSAFQVSNAVLTPRADSETMIEALLCFRPDTAAPLRMLDLGTGTGCLLLSALGEYPSAVGVGVDQSSAALEIAAGNAAALGLTSRCDLLQSDWCRDVHGRFDVVLANPPYIPTADIGGLMADVRDYEPHAALDGGLDGLDCYRTILNVTDWSADSLAGHLNPGALVLMEVGMGQAADVAALGVVQGLRHLDTISDLAGIARVVAFQHDA